MKEINDVHINIPDYICEFIKRLSEVGIGCCLVGGCVRDYFLGMVSEDFDLHCGCDMELFKDKIDGLEIICEFENVLIVEDREHRVYTISFGENLEEDFKRRDITINSFYYDYIKKTIFGFKDSFKDLEKLNISPCDIERFKEDPLKVLRAIRFSEKLEWFLDFELMKIVYEINFSKVDTKFQAFRIRNEINKHKVVYLTKYHLLSKVVEKLKEFDVHI